MRRVANLVAIVLSFVFLGMQFVPSSVPKLPAEAARPMAQVIDPKIGAILDRSCQDCHSSRTTWPWYSRVAPVSWIVAKHVEQGREMLNFSEWVNQAPSSADRNLICDAVSDGSMPLPEYTLIHRHAKLSKHDVELICNWAAAPSSPVASLQPHHNASSTGVR